MGEFIPLDVVIGFGRAETAHLCGAKTTDARIRRAYTRTINASMQVRLAARFAAWQPELQDSCHAAHGGDRMCMLRANAAGCASAVTACA